MGILYVSIIGAFVRWRWLSVACLALCLLWSLLLVSCPESPVHLARRGNNEEAKSTLTFLRGNSDITRELTEIIQSTNGAVKKPWTALFTNPVHLRPLVISLMLMLGRQLSGVNAVIFFSVNIFNAAKTTQMNSFMENVVVSSAQVAATAIAVFLVDRLGRRILLVSSALIMMISLYSLGVYFWLLNDNIAKHNIEFLPLASLCTFIVAFAIGFGPITWLMNSEIFSPDVKGIANSISATFNWTLAILVTECFQTVTGIIGVAGTFWSFACVLQIVMTYIVFFVPETKGKSLEEIQLGFK